MRKIPSSIRVILMASICCIGAMILAYSNHAAALTEQEADELAEFRATMVFLRSDCKLEMTDQKFNDALLYYALQRGWYLGNYAQFDLDKLTLNRYKDLSSIGLQKDKKCEGLQKSMSPILKRLK